MKEINRGNVLVLCTLLPPCCCAALPCHYPTPRQQRTHVVQRKTLISLVTTYLNAIRYYDAKCDVKSQFFTKLTTLLNIFAVLVWCSGGGGTEECTEVAQEQDNQDK